MSVLPLPSMDVSTSKRLPQDSAAHRALVLVNPTPTILPPSTEYWYIHSKVVSYYTANPAWSFNALDCVSPCLASEPIAPKARRSLRSASLCHSSAAAIRLPRRWTLCMYDTGLGNQRLPECLAFLSGGATTDSRNHNVNTANNDLPSTL